MAQMTVRGSLGKKVLQLEELVGDTLADKLTSLGHYAVEISPVWSGAFVNSWSLRPIGSGGGRSRTSSYGRDPKDTGRLTHSERSNAESEKADAKALIDNDVREIKDRILEDGGAVLTNRAPHAKIVDDKYLTITRVKDRFR
tara:strand:- start:5136 stop:5561 length:426 start_codon:yes stop_codon:yes gene_type:complete